MVRVVVRYGDASYDLDVDPADGVEILKMQITSLTDLDPEGQVIVGFGSGPLHELTNISGIPEGQVLTVTAGDATCATPPAIPAVHSAVRPSLQNPHSASISVSSLSASLGAAMEAANRKKEKDALALQREKGMRDMEARLLGQVQHVLVYEKPDQQAKALAVIPVAEIHRRAAESSGGTESRDAVVRSLMHWFKHEYFQWVNNAPCDHCSSGNTVNQGGTGPTPAERAYGAGAVEVYKCSDCGKITRFPRYNDPGKLMETKRGRCGEWANAFTLCCRSMGFEARHVVDWTDHVWTEVWSDEKHRWMHMDACEDAWDAPLIYSEGWNKQLTYVIAFSKDEVVDVTARYTRKYDECLARRKQCGELWLGELIESIRQSKLSQLPPARREVLLARHPAEMKELEPRNLVNRATWEAGAPLPGRQSGSAAWRAERGEIGNGSNPSASTLAGLVEGPNETLMRSGTHGGVHQDTVTFDDAAWLGSRAGSAKLRGYTVWAGDRWVHGLQAHYMMCDGDECQVLDAPVHLPPGDQPAPRTARFDPETEYMSEVRGKSGTIIDRIELVISRRGGGAPDRVEAFGGDGGTQFRFDVPEGHEVAAVYGGFGGHLHNVGLHARPMMHGQETVAAPAAADVKTAASGEAGKDVTSEHMQQKLSDAVKHFFFKLREEDSNLDPNAAAAQAVERAREWVQVNGVHAALPG